MRVDKVLTAEEDLFTFRVRPGLWTFRGLVALGVGMIVAGPIAADLAISVVGLPLLAIGLLAVFLGRWWHRDLLFAVTHQSIQRRYNDGTSIVSEVALRHTDPVDIPRVKMEKRQGRGQTRYEVVYDGEVLARGLFSPLGASKIVAVLNRSIVSKLTPA